MYNGHGDVMGITDSTGAVTKTYDYDAFGIEVNASAADTNPFRYAGEMWDDTTDTYYLRARNYDPSTGRFTTEDPAQDGLNWYAYCENNPVMFIDPSGLKPGEKFKSPDEAAKDWAYYYFAESYYVAFENASLIYLNWDENGNAYYSYTERVWGNPHTVEPAEAKRFVPKSAVVFSVIHTHPNGGDITPRDVKYISDNKLSSVYLVRKGDYGGAMIERWSEFRNGKFDVTTITRGRVFKRLTAEERCNLSADFESFWYEHIKNGCNEYACLIQDWPRIVEGGYKREK